MRAFILAVAVLAGAGAATVAHRVSAPSPRVDPVHALSDEDWPCTHVVDDVCVTRQFLTHA